MLDGLLEMFVCLERVVLYALAFVKTLPMSQIITHYLF